VEANRLKAEEYGLTFPVVLQRQWEVSRGFGIFGTPIAYLIDEAGIIATDVAVGVEPILAILSSAAVAKNGKPDLARGRKETTARRR